MDNFGVCVENEAVLIENTKICKNNLRASVRKFSGSYRIVSSFVETDGVLGGDLNCGASIEFVEVLFEHFELFVRNFWLLI